MNARSAYVPCGFPSYHNACIDGWPSSGTADWRDRAHALGHASGARSSSCRGGARRSSRLSERVCDDSRAEREARRPHLLVSVLLVAVLLLSSALFGVLSNRSYALAAHSVPSEIVVVKEGDSLWKLSTEHPISGFSTKECVRWIVERNGLSDSMLYPGQVVEVPRA